MLTQKRVEFEIRDFNAFYLISKLCFIFISVLSEGRCGCVPRYTEKRRVFYTPISKNAF